MKEVYNGVGDQATKKARIENEMVDLERQKA